MTPTSRSQYIHRTGNPGGDRNITDDQKTNCAHCGRKTAEDNTNSCNTCRRNVCNRPIAQEEESALCSELCHLDDSYADHPGTLTTEGERLKYALNQVTRAAADSRTEDAEMALAHLKAASGQSADLLSGLTPLLSIENDQEEIYALDGVATALSETAALIGRTDISTLPPGNRNSKSRIAFGENPDLSCVARRSDIPDIARAINAELEREGDAFRLPENPEEYTDTECETILETAVSEMSWEGNTLTLCRWIEDGVPTAEHLASTEPTLRRFLYPNERQESSGPVCEPPRQPGRRHQYLVSFNSEQQASDFERKITGAGGTCHWVATDDTPLYDGEYQYADTGCWDTLLSSLKEVVSQETGLDEWPEDETKGWTTQEKRNLIEAAVSRWDFIGHNGLNRHKVAEDLKAGRIPWTGTRKST